MLEGIRLEGDSMILDGYTPGGTVHGLETASASELKRLAVFRADLDRALTWLHSARQITQAGGPPNVTAEALNEAALLAFCRCFESTKAERSKPLKAKKIFSVEQRAQYYRLKNIRDKMVAHDERLFGGVFAIVVRDPDMNAEDVLALTLSAPFSVFPERESLWELANRAYERVETERLELIERMKAEFNELPLDERRSLPIFTTTAVAADPLASSGQGGRA